MSYYTVTVRPIDPSQSQSNVGIAFKDFLSNHQFTNYKLARIGATYSAKLNDPNSWSYYTFVENLSIFSVKYSDVYFILEEHPGDLDILEDLWQTYIAVGKYKTVEAIITVSFPDFDIDELE